MFRDISLIEDDEHERKTIPAPVNPKYAHVHQYALLVAGDSMNNKFQDGSYVTCAEWAGLGKELKHGMILHVERVKAGSMIETTIKKYIERDGKRWLEPDSTNSKHLPIEINGGLDTEIHIKGAVIGSYTEFDI
jgi:phage repressor protein C with HTH and peptisase S24 domain